MELKRGDRVIYSPWRDCPAEERQRGIVKTVCNDGRHAFVLYHTRAMTYTAADLDNYTAARTSLDDLSREDHGA